MVAAAYDRYNRGNPPRKDRKYGDAINWECLLKTVPYGCDLYLVSADKDYRSLFSDEEINPFLKNEWKEKKGSEIHFFTSLVKLTKTKFENIQLRDEQKKQELIDALLSSDNYEKTHAIISGLCRFNDWTAEQMESLCEAVIKNEQVGNIIGYSDVFWFYNNLFSKVKYDEIGDCYTKTVMGWIFNIEQINDRIAYKSDARADYEAERMDALENYYAHIKS